MPGTLTVKSVIFTYGWTHILLNKHVEYSDQHMGDGQPMLGNKEVKLIPIYSSSTKSKIKISKSKSKIEYYHHLISKILDILYSDQCLVAVHPFCIKKRKK